MTEKKTVSAQQIFMGGQPQLPHLGEHLNQERRLDELRASNAALVQACGLALVRLEGGSLTG
jgi:hypothetical protein